MKLTHLLSLAAASLLAAGCSYMNLSDPTDTEIALGEAGLIQSRDSSVFYYYFGEKIFLTEHKDMAFLQLSDNSDAGQSIQAAGANSALRVRSAGASIGGDTPLRTSIIESTTGIISKEQMRALRNDESVRSISYMTEYNGHMSAVSDNFYVKLKDVSDYSKFNELVLKYNCEASPQAWSGPDEFSVRIPRDSDMETIQLANIFYETGLFEFSSPDFFLFDMLTEADPYYSYQWGLKNTGQYSTKTMDINVESAWAITEGSEDIIIAIVDDGVETTHPDLAAQMVPGYDAYGQSGGSPTGNDSHGTAVAGIIGAVKDNGIGISGIAPGCKLMPVRTFINNTTTESLSAAGINWAWNNGADVINCSWGGGQPSAILSQAISNATSQGRDGKGCVVVFSSGNGNGAVSYPASYERSIAVGAISYDGFRKSLSSPDGEAWGSNYGSTLDVVAPGVRVPTTDRTGSYGFNTAQTTNDLSNTDYTRYFNGTSAAAPHVSGVAALMLSKYPDLTYSQVLRAIQLSCTKLSGYTYSKDSGSPAGSRNNEVGYGLINARDALSRANTFHNENVQNSTPGIDFIITNYSSYFINDIYIGLRGIVDGVYTTLIACDPGGLASGDHIGYPLYRGFNINASPGAEITDLQLEFYGHIENCSDYVSIGAAIDTQNIQFHDYHNFMLVIGNTYWVSIPDSTVPDGCRRTLYVNIHNRLY